MIVRRSVTSSCLAIAAVALLAQSASAGQILNFSGVPVTVEGKNDKGQVVYSVSLPPNTPSDALTWKNLQYLDAYYPGHGAICGFNFGIYRWDMTRYYLSIHQQGTRFGCSICDHNHLLIRYSSGTREDVPNKSFGSPHVGC